MDLGPATRLLAPLKLRHAPAVAPQNLIKLKPPPADPSIDPTDTNVDAHLFNHSMFHHLCGLSNLRRILAPKCYELDLSLSSCDDSFVKEDSYDNLKDTKKQSSFNNLSENSPANQKTEVK